MNKCNFCGIRTIRPKYCSSICIKRNWYKLRHPDSYFNHSKKFWKTETGLAFKWEKYSAKLLKAKHLEFTQGADLNWKGKLIDVKVANLWRRKFKKGKPVKSKQMGVWVFNRNKKKLLDFFFCIALLKNKPFKIFLIPEKEFPKSGIVIGWKSKYDKFLYSLNNIQD